MLPSAIQAALAARQYSLELVHARDAEGRPVFLYMLINAARLDEFRRSLGTPRASMREIGTVVYQAEGEHPTDAQHAEAMRRLQAYHLKPAGD